MFQKRTLAAVFLAMSTQLAGAEEIYIEWTESGDISPDYTFTLDLQLTDISGAFTLNGYMEYSGGNREATIGSAAYSPNEGVYVVSLFFNSSTGESFSIGANLDPVTLSGPGTLIRMAHGSVNADKSGTLTVPP